MHALSSIAQSQGLLSPSSPVTSSPSTSLATKHVTSDSGQACHLASTDDSVKLISGISGSSSKSTCRFSTLVCARLSVTLHPQLSQYPHPNPLPPSLPLPQPTQQTAPAAFELNLGNLRVFHASGIRGNDDKDMLTATSGAKGGASSTALDTSMLLVSARQFTLLQLPPSALRHATAAMSSAASQAGLRSPNHSITPAQATTPQHPHPHQFQPSPLSSEVSQGPPASTPSAPGLSYLANRKAAGLPHHSPPPHHPSASHAGTKQSPFPCAATHSQATPPDVPPHFTHRNTLYPSSVQSHQPFPSAPPSAPTFTAPAPATAAPAPASVLGPPKRPEWMDPWLAPYEGIAAHCCA